MEGKVTSSDSQVNFGPIELIIDLPIAVGCFEAINGFSLGAAVSSVTDQTPVKCLTSCLQAGLRFAALNRGSDCHCLEDLENLITAPKSECELSCTGTHAMRQIKIF